MNESTDEQLHEADRRWAEAWHGKEQEACMAVFASDAVMLALGREPVVGVEAIDELLAEVFAVPGFTTSIQVSQAVVAASGDLGYTLGTYESSMAGGDGKTATHGGKYVAVWRRDASGTWKVAVHSSSPN